MHNAEYLWAKYSWQQGQLFLLVPILICCHFILKMMDVHVKSYLIWKREPSYHVLSSSLEQHVKNERVKALITYPNGINKILKLRKCQFPLSYFSLWNGRKRLKRQVGQHADVGSYHLEKPHTKGFCSFVNPGMGLRGELLWVEMYRVLSENGVKCLPDSPLLPPRGASAKVPEKNLCPGASDRDLGMKAQGLRKQGCCEHDWRRDWALGWNSPQRWHARWLCTKPGVGQAGFPATAWQVKLCNCLWWGLNNHM